MNTSALIQQLYEIEAIKFGSFDAQKWGDFAHLHSFATNYFLSQTITSYFRSNVE